MSKITRRNALARGGQAVAAAAVLSTLPTIAHAKEDAELLSRVEAFWAAHEEEKEKSDKRTANYNAITALPECPSFRDHPALSAFFEKHGQFALSDAANKANKRQGKAVKAVFGIPAKTHQGVLAKLKIVEVAYGTGNEDGDTDLDCWQDLDAPWLENVIADFERLLSGRAI